MKNLIKPSDTHYVIIDDSEIKILDWYLCESSMYPKQCIKCEKNLVEDGLGNQDSLKFSKKITHSTQPLENVQFISLSKVEEVVLGYNLEEMTQQHLNYHHNNEDIAHPEMYDMYNSYIGGFKANQELVKDKLFFTIQDMKYMFECGRNYQNNAEITFKVAIQHLLPTMEWLIDFNKEGKIILL